MAYKAGENGEHNRYSKYALTVDHHNFIREYIKSGCVDVMGAAERAGFNPKYGHTLMRRPAIKGAITRMQKRLSNSVEMDLNYKLKKLKQIIDSGVPEEAVNIDEMKPMPVIAAIAEANKMQGHYSAEKHENVNLNIDTDIQRVKVLVDELTEKYQRDY